MRPAATVYLSARVDLNSKTESRVMTDWQLS